MHFSQGAVFVSHVAQTKSHADDMEMIVGKRQLFGITNGCWQGHAGIKQAVASTSQHRFVDVGVHDMPGFTHFFRKGQRQVASAPGDVEHHVAISNIGYQQGEGLPGAVQAQRHQVIHDVIAGRHRIKHATDMPRFVGFVNRFVTKVGCCHGCRRLNDWRSHARPFRA